MRRFSEMRTEQLKKTMEEEIRKSNPERSTVMECLQELKRREPEGAPDKVLEAWEASQQIKRPPVCKPWKRIAVAAAIIVLVLIITVPSAFGAENFFEWVGRWTKDIFSFGKLHEDEFVFQTDHPGLQELYDTVTALGAEKNVVPTWLPDGYNLEQLEILEREDSTTVIANFIDQKREIVINIMIFASTPEAEYQKSGELVEDVEIRDITHYIVENNNTYTAVWVAGNTECSLSAYSEELLHKLLLSIYRQEE